MDNLKKPYRLAFHTLLQSSPKEDGNQNVIFYNAMFVGNADLRSKDFNGRTLIINSIINNTFEILDVRKAFPPEALFYHKEDCL